MSNVSSTLDQQPVVYIGPDGGTTGQVLAKKSNTDRDMEWATISTSAFASGTVMLFAQTAAPTGWTKITTHDNKAFVLYLVLLVLVVL